MRVRLEKDLQLIITPETYIEQVALTAWIKDNENRTGGLLIEAYTDNGKLSYCPCHLPQVHGHLEKNCPHYIS